ncbi:hypothetical protein GGX14DRAFT_409997 [Mycena pura]|uniref:MYND-type domain-containing protein n=1 Tax=Mycena pura TaxID=153505 RepID=A0AAD6YUZ4_9AGAR|nr:hypothetical protein GGX14DRAFT_409997 [Mycena pura]
MSTNNQLPMQIHAIHPDNKKNFKALATPRKDIRATRTGMRTACTKCFKTDLDHPELELRRCGKCKGVWYCSKECQTAHWPQHKKSCKEVEGSGFQKLVQNFYSNPILNKHLQACFIIHFDLLRRPVLDAPFMARVDIAIEPADMPAFFNVFCGEPVPAGTFMGMLQVNRFTPLSPEAMADLTPMRREIWRQARESADKSGYAGHPVGLVEFGTGDSEQTLTCAVHVQPGAMELVRQAPPWEMKSSITGKVTEKPFNIETCMEFMNTHIRADKKNQLLLRTEMRPFDIQVIRDAATNSDSLAAQVLRAKMRREDIFTPIMVGKGFAQQVPLV